MRLSLLRIAALAPVLVLTLVSAPASTPPPGGLGECAPGDPDVDNDGVPDACDLDDGWIFIEMAGPSTIHYQIETLYGAYNLYRGELIPLRAPPNHMVTQNPEWGNAASWCDETSGILEDPWTPPPGTIVYFVATGSMTEGESFPGLTDAGQGRPHHFPCHFCGANAACSPDHFCEKAPGNCTGRGVCAQRPAACPDVWAPVCGCDGVTYGNACDASAAGANVLHEGTCEPTCLDNVECTSTEYCLRSGENCAGEGTCEPRPQACTALWEPVCGCDGVTYSNACEAAMAGVSVEHLGECPMACTSNTDCTATQYCDHATGDCSGPGACLERPEFCPQDIDPVCGCDGVTYQNACTANQAGTSVRRAGDCSSCTTNAECPATHYCLTAGCGGQGTCTARPAGCTTLWYPVCGCDGQTYPNPCAAERAGVTIWHLGECGVGCTSNDHCTETQYCHTDTGACNSLGHCVSRPVFCPTDIDPVCGCDGRTYNNACEAQRSGTSVSHTGSCACTSNAECVPDQFCLTPLEECGVDGVCATRPLNCSTVNDDVCGCDGQRYLNVCTAYRAGVNIAPESVCTP